jgi:hypothetical protein
MTKQYLIYGGLVVGAVGLYFLAKNKNKGGGLLESLGFDTEGNTTEAPKKETPVLATPPLVSNPIGDLITTTTDSLNLASATLLLAQRSNALTQSQEPAPDAKNTLFGNLSLARIQWAIRTNGAKAQISQVDAQLRNLGYKVDESGKLIKA